MSEILQRRQPWLNNQILQSNKKQYVIVGDSEGEVMQAVCSHAQSENAAMAEALAGTFRVQDIKNGSKICQIVTIGKTCALDSTINSGNKIEIMNCEISDGRNYMRAIIPISVLSKAAIGTFAGKSLKDWKYSLINVQEYRLLVCQRQNSQNRQRYLTGRIVVTKLQPITFDVGTLIGQPLYLFSDNKVKSYVTTLENMIYNGFPEQEQRSLVSMDSMALLNHSVNSQDMAGIDMIAENFTQTQAPVVTIPRETDMERQAQTITSDLISKICQDLDFDHVLSELYKSDILDAPYADHNTSREADIVPDQNEAFSAQPSIKSPIIEQPQLEDLVPALDETMSDHSLENTKDSAVEDESILAQQQSDYVDTVDESIPKPEDNQVQEVMPSAEIILTNNGDKFGSNSLSSVEQNESSQAILNSSIEYRIPMPKFSSFPGSDIDGILTQTREQQAAEAVEITPTNPDEILCEETTAAPEPETQAPNNNNNETRILESLPQDIMNTEDDYMNTEEATNEDPDGSLEILECEISVPPAPRDAKEWREIPAEPARKRQRRRIDLDSIDLERIPIIYCDHNKW